MKQVKSYPWLWVSENLDIVSKARTNPRVLTQGRDKDGYRTVSTRYKGKAYYLRVHRLIAEVYIPNPENRPFVNHKDGLKHNNNVINLEWVTAKENTIHAYKNGLIKINFGEDASNSVYRESVIREICIKLQEGLSNKEVCSLFPEVHPNLVKDVRAGRSWATVSKDYTFRKFSGRCGLDSQTVTYICTMLECGERVASIAKRSGVSESSVYHIKRRNSYKNISKNFNFK